MLSLELAQEWVFITEKTRKHIRTISLCARKKTWNQHDQSLHFNIAARSGTNQ